jgi:hypothetical protein
MGEQDWYGPFGNGGWRPITTAIIGAIITIESLLGYAFDRKAWIGGTREPPTQYLEHPDWTFLAIGVGILFYAFLEWRRLRR